VARRVLVETKGGKCYSLQCGNLEIVIGPGKSRCVSALVVDLNLPRVRELSRAALEARPARFFHFEGLTLTGLAERILR
jgi:hypothetical protein